MFDRGFFLGISPDTINHREPFFLVITENASDSGAGRGAECLRIDSSCGPTEARYFRVRSSGCAGFRSLASSAWSESSSMSASASSFSPSSSWLS